MIYFCSMMISISFVEFNIGTGESSPIKQAARRVPCATRQKIAAQLSKMQDGGVI